MSYEFKEGDKVKCINAEGFGHITFNKTYTVLFGKANHINITNDRGEAWADYPCSHFELVKRPSIETKRWELLSAMKCVERYNLRRYYDISMEIVWAKGNSSGTKDPLAVLDAVLPLEDSNKELIESLEQELRGLADKQNELADKLKELKQ